MRNCYQSLADGGIYDALRDAAVAENCQPQACHEPVPDDDASRIHPWRTQHTATWLTDDGSGTLIVPALAENASTCFADGSRGACADDAVADARADAAAFVDLIEQAVGTYRTTPAAGDTLHWTWSTRNLPETDYINEIFRALTFALRARGLAGSVLWSTLTEVAGANP